MSGWNAAATKSKPTDTDKNMTIAHDELILHTYTEDAYLQYAVATVKDRALAQVQDGLKPVQRRILYTMRQLGLSASVKPVKSARVVGDVLGKYHPHGDQAAYDAMVRMAQTFTLRYPLILGQGNFGSRDGDTAAAMRYTEAKLSPIAELLLSELGQGTVDFQPNYDGTLEEPCLLPARMPFLLLNGTMGIAVGMASDIPPHNAREVARAAAKVLKDPEGTTLADVLQDIQGPDFPGGGQLVSTPQEVQEAYTGGRGSLRCRARWFKEDLARGQWQIVINELPYQVSTRSILEQLDKLTNPQVPTGKKSITQQQSNLKQLALEMLEKAVDESDKDSGIRLVLTPRTSKVDADVMMAFLLANTDLETSVSLNFTLVGLDGSPTTKGLLSVLQEWASYRVETARRRTKFELEAAEDRIHILQGRMTVFLNLDKVISVIREADEPKDALMAEFSLSVRQADDILEMRLRQLNRLEGIKLEKELDELRKEAERLKALLASDKLMRAMVVKELEADTEKFGDDRRTLVKPEAKASQATLAPSVVDEPSTIVISKNLWVKAYKGHGLDDSAFAFKAGDSLLFKAEVQTTQAVILMDSRGRIYNFAASTVPSGRGDGAPLSTFIDLQAGAKPFAVITGGPEDVLLFAGEKGCGFTAPLKSLATRQKAGKTFLDLDTGEAPLQPLRLGEMPLLACSSTEGKLLAFQVAEVPARPNGGKGVVLMDLADEARLAALLLVDGKKASLAGRSSETGKAVTVKLDEESWAKHIGKRARKGAFLAGKAVLKAA